MKRLFEALSAALLLLSGAKVLHAAPDVDLVFLEDKVQRDPEDFSAWNKLGDHYLSLLRISGDMKWLTRAAGAAQSSLKAVHSPFNSAGLGVRGRVELAQHHFREALATGRALKEMRPDQVGGLVLICDASFELGDYASAERSLREAVKMDEEISVGSESREAKFSFIHGRLDEAAKHLERALALTREQPTAAETIAWCEVQQGELAFKRGRWEEAEAHYRAARQALPGWYVTEEHLAELRGAQGGYEEAAAEYEKIVGRLPRPELLQALGDLLVFAGKAEAAQPWYEKARAAYERSIDAGEQLFVHHASGFFADSLPEPGKALQLAERDVGLRPSVYAWDALAWAQYKSGQMKEAVDSMAKALATGIQDPHILYHASMIHMSAGDLKAGKEFLRQTVAVNSRYNSFHVHR